jgi:hypothetical protein
MSHVKSLTVVDVFPAVDVITNPRPPGLVVFGLLEPCQANLLGFLVAREGLIVTQPEQGDHKNHNSCYGDPQKLSGICHRLHLL